METHFKIKIGNECTTIETADELVAVLDVLQGQYDKEVLQQLAPNLHLIIRNSKELLKIVGLLPNEDQIFLFRILGDHLIEIIGSGSSLRDLLAHLLADEVKIRLIQSLKPEGIQKLIRNAKELAEVLEWVYGSQDRTVVNYLSIETIQKLIKGGSDLGLVLRAVEPDFQEYLLKELGHHYLVGVIHQTEDFASLLKVLPFETSKLVIDSLNDAKIKDLIRSADDLAYINRYLDQFKEDYLKHKLEGISYAP